MMVFEQPITNLFEAVSIMALQFSRESYMTLLSSTTIVTNPLQPPKAERLMDVTEFGMVTEVKPLQPAKAPSPIVVTLLGMAMEVRPLQPAKALPLIDVIPSGIA
jgi:hypothetical protein